MPQTMWNSARRIGSRDHDFEPCSLGHLTEKETGYKSLNKHFSLSIIN